MKIFDKKLFLALILFQSFAFADFEQNRLKFIEFLRSAGMKDELEAPVRMTCDERSLLSISDEGNFLIQYLTLTPSRSSDPNIINDIDGDCFTRAKKLVITTHGWLDKADGKWPADIAAALREIVDPNDWICGYYDWSGGSQVANPIDAAKYSRDIAGPRLAAAVLSLDQDFDHVHLIAHSAGCWGINSAAEIINEKIPTDIHLTFLDAYVPPKWPQEDLGNITAKYKHNVFAEHYYTKDITLYVTHHDLDNACNIDLSNIDVGLHAHEFPYRWYYATIAGQYRRKDSEFGNEVYTVSGKLNYGIARAKESGYENWKQSLALKDGDETICLEKPKLKKRPFWKKK
jgi:hypothetical protein